MEYPRPHLNFPASQRRIPLLVGIVAVIALLAIPLRIVMYGFVPAGDARRHVARAVTDRTYDQILVLRPQYKIDHSPGWNWILRTLHRVKGWDEDDLMSFSVGAMMLCLLVAGLPWVRRPEAWVGALLTVGIAGPDLMVRLSQGRPFLLSEGVLVCILFAWAEDEPTRPSSLKLVLTTVALALSVWIHGAWYLWVLVLAGFLLAGAWRRAWWLGICWVAGVIAGALLSGQPLDFLYGAVYMADAVGRENVPKWLLVGEFQPNNGDFYTLAVLAAVYLWRRPDGGAGRLLRQPVFWVIALSWVLGLNAQRFWGDWGLPAALVWLALQFDELLTARWPAEAGVRLLLCGLVAAPLYLTTTNDLGRRYTRNLAEVFLDGADPSLRGWLPEGDGIFYSAEMGFFFNTFYKNPQAGWRYLTGFEPALMPEDDLKTYRTIQMTDRAWPSYEPWVKKMRPQDRLEIGVFNQPAIPELEWHYAPGPGMWIGRTPREK